MNAALSVVIIRYSYIKISSWSVTVIKLKEHVLITVSVSDGEVALQ